MRNFSSNQTRSGNIQNGSPLIWFYVSATVCFGLFIGALSISSFAISTPGGGEQSVLVRVYCASAVVEPMNKIINQFNSSKLATSENFVVDIVRSGGSGALAGQISTEVLTEVQSMADVFVCSDSNRISELVDKNMIVDRFQIAAQFPVLAVRGNSDLNLNQAKDFQSLLNLEMKIGVGSVSSAIGFETVRFAKQEGCGELLQACKTAEFENVMSIAQALSLGSIDVAVVWDSTVVQFNQTGSPPIKIFAFLDAAVAGPTSLNPLEIEPLALGNLPPAIRSDKFSFNKSTLSAQSKCFVEVGRSKSSSHHADLFFRYLQDNRDKLQDNFIDAGFSSYLSEPLPQ